MNVLGICDRTSTRCRGRTRTYWRWQSHVLNQQFCSLFDLTGTFAQCQAVQYRERLPNTNRNKSCSVCGLGITLTGKFKPWLSRDWRKLSLWHKHIWRHFEQSDSAHVASCVWHHRHGWCHMQTVMQITARHPSSWWNTSRYILWYFKNLRIFVDRFSHPSVPLKCHPVQHCNCEMILWSLFPTFPCIPERLVYLSVVARLWL